MEQNKPITREEKLQDFGNHGKEILVEIIEIFAKEGVIFANESQFQFQLGARLQQLFDECELGYKVRFEELSFDPKDAAETNDKKNYTDLVVEMGDKLVAIELKYKTAKSNNDIVGFKYKMTSSKNYYVAAQGAHDNGCFDFWWDVHRLEQLINEQAEFFSLRKKVVKGFAIIITNDLFYSKGYTNKCNQYFRNFILRESDDTNTIKTLKWFDGKNDVDKLTCAKDKKNWRYNQSISLTNRYPIEWKKYNLDISKIVKVIKEDEYRDIMNEDCRTELDKDKYSFQYLILEIPPKNLS